METEAPQSSKFPQTKAAYIMQLLAPKTMRTTRREEELEGPHRRCSERASTTMM